MKMTGKILFFNESDGKGILITTQRQKVGFGVQDWDDFDVMPSLGLEVSFEQDGDKAINVISKLTEAAQEESAVNANETVQEESPADTVIPPEEVPTQPIDTPQEVVPEVAESIVEEVDKEVQEEELPPDVVVFPDEEELPPDVVVFPDEQEETQSDQVETPDGVTPPAIEVSTEEPEESQEEELPPDVVVFPDEPEEVEHFEAEDAIDLLAGMEEDLEPREESITLSLNLTTAVGNYFDVIKKHIERRLSYKKVEGRLDYLVTRRFIWTTFNNLSEIDLHIITPKIKMLSDDLKLMSKVYDDFSIKIKHPPLAFAEVFLACQSEYNKIREGAQKVIDKLNLLKSNEKIIGGVLRVKKEEVDKNIKSEEYDVLKDELKSLNGAYVDVVHMMAELDERYKHDLAILNKFEEEYRADFYEIFESESKKYKKDLLEILNAQAYIVDAQLWQQAKISKSVKAHFKKSSIIGELNTKTYLKYYLDTLDSSRATGDTKKLFELYDYLVTQQKDYIMVVVSSAQDAMEYEQYIKNADKSYDVKSFIDEKSAIKWAMKNSVKVLVVEDRLQNTTAETFLNVYHNNVLVRPKIILMGTKPTKGSNSYTISKLLMKNATSRVVADSVKAVLEAK